MNNLTTESREFGGVAACSTSPVGPLNAEGHANGPDPQWAGLPCGAIELRVTRAGTPARRLQINSNRCTFGSGEGCTVRLSDTSLRPLHAVILRETGRVLIRGYTIPIEINGQFSIESFLDLGDVFRLGQYCFEMIGLPGSTRQGGAAPQFKPADRGRDAIAAATAGNAPARGNDLLSGADDPAPQAGHARRLRFAPDPHSSAAGTSDLGLVLRSEASLRGNDTSLPSLIAVHLQAKRNTQLLGELETARLREQEVRQQLAEAIERFEHSQQQATHASEAVSDLQNRITTLTEQMEALAVEAESRHTRTSEEQAKLQVSIAASKEAEAASQQAELASRKAEAEAIRQRDAALAQRAEAIDSEQAAQAKMRQASQQVQQLTQQCEQASQLLEQAQQEVAQGRAQIDQLQSQCHAQAEALARDRQEHAEVVSQNASLIDQLSEEVRQLQQELDQSQQRAQNAAIDQQNLAALRSDHDKTVRQHLADKQCWQEQIADLQETIQQLSGELATAAGRLSESETRYTDLRQEIDEVHQQLAVVQQEAAIRPSLQQWDDLRTQLAQAETQLAETEGQLARLREDYDRLLEDNEQAIQNQSAGAEDQSVDQATEPEPMSPSHWNSPAASDYPNAAAEEPFADERSDPAPASLSSLWQQAERSESESTQWPESDCTVAIPESLISDSASAAGSDWLTRDAPQELDDSVTPPSQPLLDQPADQRGWSESIDRDDARDDQDVSDCRDVSDYQDVSTVDDSAEELLEASNDPLESHGVAQLRKQRAFDERALRDSLASDVGEIAEDVSDDYPNATLLGRGADPSRQDELASTQESEANEDSVEAYMSRLLQRMGHSPTPVPSAAETRSVPKTETTTRTAVVSEPEPPSPRSEASDVPLAPRSHAPERHGHLDAMRQLANESALSAISVSNQGQARALKSQAMVNLLQATVVLICSAVFFYCGQKNPALKYVWYTAGTLACGLAMFFMYDTVRKLVTARQTARIAPPSDSSPDEEDEL